MLCFFYYPIVDDVEKRIKSVKQIARNSKKFTFDNAKYEFTNMCGINSIVHALIHQTELENIREFSSSNRVFHPNLINAINILKSEGDTPQYYMSKYFYLIDSVHKTRSYCLSEKFL